MKKDSKPKKMDIRMKAGITLMIVSCVIVIITIAVGSVNFSNMGADITGSINDKVDFDTDEVFEDNYYVALNAISNTVGFGTTWLDICPNSNTIINGESYSKVCSSEYSSKQNIINYLKKYLTSSFIDGLLGDYYIDYNGSLYVKVVSINKNQDYIDMSSYKAISVQNNKIEYEVTSKYKNSKNKTHSFTLINENGNWLVDSMELPY